MNDEGGGRILLVVGVVPGIAVGFAAYLFMLCTWSRKLRTPPAGYPGLRRVLDAVSDRAAVQRACAAEGTDPGLYAGE